MSTITKKKSARVTIPRVDDFLDCLLPSPTPKWIRGVGAVGGALAPLGSKRTRQ